MYLHIKSRRYLGAKRPPDHLGVREVPEAVVKDRTILDNNRLERLRALIRWWWCVGGEREREVPGGSGLGELTEQRPARPQGTRISSTVVAMRSLPVGAGCPQGPAGHAETPPFTLPRR